MSLNLQSYVRVLPADLQQAENELFNDYIAFSTKDDSKKDVRLEPIVATDVKTQEVFFSPKFQAFFKSQNLSEKELKEFFLTRHAKHIQEFKDVTSTATNGYDDSVMLTVISSAYMERKTPPHEIPGELYHRDGRGNALSVKIALTTPRVWEYGQLNIVKPQAGEDGDKTILGKKHSELAPIDAPRLEHPGEAFLLNNKEVYHAVVTPNIPLDSSVESGRRTIYQERLNRREGFNRAFLEPYMS